jgi:AraC-like DNA-binding protein
MMIGMSAACPSEPQPWELLRRAPHPALRLLVSEYQGYREFAAHSIQRRETATSVFPLILNFGPTFRISGGYAPGGPRDLSSFIAGLGDTFALVESAGGANCMQANLSPLGAYRLLGLPLCELATQVVDFEDLFGRAARRLTERLHNAPGWPDRFKLLDAFFLERLGMSRPASPEVEHAWLRLKRSRGRLRVEALAADEGWSRKHLTRRFQIEVGASPKVYARILRFEHAHTLAQASPRPSWTEVALACGYADHAHLIREFRALAGLTPPELLRRTDPGGGGVLE